MAARRPLTPFVATLAVAALSVGGVLVGTAPVSAAPARSAECTAALDALEDEFGDVVFDFDEELSEELQAQVDALFVAYEDEVVPLYEQLGLDYFEVDIEAAYEVLDAAEEEFETAAAARDAAQSVLDDADEELRLAEAALLEATTGGDPDEITAAEAARDLAAEAQVAAAGEFAPADAAADAAEDVLTEVETVVEAIEVLDIEFWDALDELLPYVDELDIERLLELLTAFALECNDDGEGSGSGSGSDSGSGKAPVATPVAARASFTG
ncbi:hypothetical protein [Aquipuribacter sp. MA13-6]|uniref:hypothetical protein n=1 Tax=unclassified Aquipuribacter TaxID=2635084 RepID=UPI003EE91CF1